MGQLYQFNKEERNFMKVSGGSVIATTNRHVGEIFHSLLPINVAGIHLVDGSLLYSDGIYSSFYNYMVQLQESGNADSIFITEEEWQNSVSTYGVCGKFVLDTANGTVRLPKVTGHVEGTIDASALGDLVEAGLPNLKGRVGGAFVWNPQTASGVFKINTGNLNTKGPGSGSEAGAVNLDIDASEYSPIYRDDITTVQTQSIKGFIYIVVGTYSKTELQVNIDNMIAELQRKTDAAAAAHAAMPSSKYIDLELPESGGTVTAPADGYIAFHKDATATTQFLALNNHINNISVISCGIVGGLRVMLPVSKDDNIHVEYTAAGTTQRFCFVYCNGNAPAE